MHENRETSGAPRPERERGRSAKAQSQKADANAPEESDRNTINEPDEQRRAIFGGAWGEKGAGQGEHRSTQHHPDTERGMSVPGIERCARSSKEKEAGTVHGFASPYYYGTATTP
jgi:hypothetical protein